LLDTLFDNWLPIVGGLVILLLGGYGYYRSKQKQNGHGETRLGSDLGPDSKLPPDSYFGASGGQRVDTHDAANTGASSSMAYSPSQLEAVGDVDPVSEADVYLAYGRDAQAEEILKEALRTYPGRISLYAKLAEIYAKQRNATQLEAVATEARRVTHGEGREWQGIVALGQQVDPGNALYALDQAPAAQTPPVEPPPSTGPREPEFDQIPAAPQDSLDLEMSSSKPLLTPPAEQPDAPYEPTVPATLPVSIDTDETHRIPLRAAENVDFTPPAQQPQAQSNSGLMEFDMSESAALTPSGSAQTKSKSTDEDPLATKLALAQEFHAIGDNNSARTLVREVLAAATGALKTKAQQFLDDLG
jgi:pilus assembly protein FimV